MFSRGRLAAKYKEYAKHLQGLQNNYLKKNKDLYKLLNNVEHTKVKVLSWNLNKALSSVQDKFNNKRLQNDHHEASTKIRQRLAKFAMASGVVVAAAPTEPAVVSPQAASEASIKSQDGIIIEPIPEPPVVPEGGAEILDATTVTELVNALGEPTFASIGLGGWSPVGLAQNCFEYLHVSLGVPWWEAIVLGTLFIRTLLFPLVILAQRNAAKMNNVLPQMQVIQMKMSDARLSGNQLDALRYTQELQHFMKEKDISLFKNMLVPLAQMPIFISFFMALRGMANLPVDSLRTGGLWWFTDLTVPDQFYLMPLITSLTLYATIELGTDSAKLNAQSMQTMKYVLRALPVVIFPFIVNFPGAILCYWVSTNFVSLAQVGILKIPAVRDYFKIEQLVTHKSEQLPMKEKGFTKGIKESWTNMRITRDLADRERYDELQFQRAGKGSLVKTYKFDPTKHINTKNISTKKK